MRITSVGAKAWPSKVTSPSSGAVMRLMMRMSVGTQQAKHFAARHLNAHVVQGCMLGIAFHNVWGRKEHVVIHEINNLLICIRRRIVRKNYTIFWKKREKHRKSNSKIHQLPVACSFYLPVQKKWLCKDFVGVNSPTSFTSSWQMLNRISLFKWNYLKKIHPFIHLLAVV